MRWTISVFLLSFGASVVIANISLAIRWYQYKKRGTMIPFLGGILAAIGLAVLPIENVGNFWWFVLLLDPGCALLALGVIVENIREHKKTQH